MATLWEKIKAEGGALLAHLEPFARAVAEDEVKALAPLARQAALEVAASAANSGNLNDFASAAAGTLIATAHKAETLGIQAGGASLLAAVGGVLSAPPAAAEDPAAPAPAAAASPAQPTKPTTAAVPAKPAAATSGDAS